MRRGQRLQRPEQFQRVRRDGKSWSHPLLHLNALRNRVGRTRCGFVVGKQFGKAHDRNRVKRRVREAVRVQYTNIAAGYDLVFVVRPAAAQASFADLQRACRDVVQRAGLWVESASEGSGHAAVDRSGADPLLPALHLTSDSS